jgi:hypothetical protein
MCAYLLREGGYLMRLPSLPDGLRRLLPFLAVFLVVFVLFFVFWWGCGRLQARLDDVTSIAATASVDAAEAAASAADDAIADSISLRITVITETLHRDTLGRINGDRTFQQYTREVGNWGLNTYVGR